jgi:hypothetical protein
MPANRCFAIVVPFIFLTPPACAKHSIVDTTRGNVPPTDTISKTELFKKVIPYPLFDIGNDKPTWRSIHTANVSILTPDETIDGKWRLFMLYNVCCTTVDFLDWVNKK